MNTLNFILKKNNLTFHKNTKIPVEIPNTSRYDLAKWLRELDFKMGVEVGVAQGNYSRVLCELNPQMRIFGVDAYKSYEQYSDFPQEKLDEFYLDARYHLRSFRKRYQIIKKFSSEALSGFEDNSLDFVYIDGNHTEPFVTEDLTNWSGKVKPGGIISGHDYIKRKKDPWVVKDSVDKFVSDNHIIPLFILGLKQTSPGIVREETRSWMWIKE